MCARVHVCTGVHRLFPGFADEKWRYTRYPPALSTRLTPGLVSALAAPDSRLVGKMIDSRMLSDPSHALSRSLAVANAATRGLNLSMSARGNWNLFGWFCFQLFTMDNGQLGTWEQFGTLIPCASLQEDVLPCNRYASFNNSSIMTWCCGLEIHH